MRQRSLWITLALLGCDADVADIGGTGPVEEFAEKDDRAVERTATLPPIYGGTLMITGSGFAIASDPARDVIHVVDLQARREVAVIELDPGAHPFRAVEDDDGFVHVTLRSAGAVVKIDPEGGARVSTTAVCPNPRGIAYASERNELYVACAGGSLVGLDAASGEVTRWHVVAPDLRDVFARDGEVYVSRFRAAEILAVAEDGTTTPAGGPVSPTHFGTLFTPNTAWRTFGRDDGGWFMLHQLATTDPLDTDPPERGGNGYGGEFVDPCGGAAKPALSGMGPDGTIVTSGTLKFMTLAVDAALSPDGTKLAVASPSHADDPEFVPSFLPTGVATIRTEQLLTGTDDRCVEARELPVVEDFVAVAFTHDGDLIGQTLREPTLYRFRNSDHVDTIALEGEPIRDTGHDLFHFDTGSGLSCAMCHPEGGDDGNVWGFRTLGPRRTQPLNAQLRDTAPFHWDGDMEDMIALTHEVRTGRMGGIPQTEARVQALEEWVFSLRTPNPLRAQHRPRRAAGRGAVHRAPLRRLPFRPEPDLERVRRSGAGPAADPTAEGRRAATPVSARRPRARSRRGNAGNA